MGYKTEQGRTLPIKVGTGHWCPEKLYIPYALPSTQPPKLDIDCFEVGSRIRSRKQNVIKFIGSFDDYDGSETITS
jgi:hypothetical protein